MKLSAMFFLALTTFILIGVTLMVAMDLAFTWVFFVTLIGQIFLVYTVYRVLTDNYKTEKTFEDWYEDQPIEKG